jgi:hypothetical protein
MDAPEPMTGRDSRPEGSARINDVAKAPNHNNFLG